MEKMTKTEDHRYLGDGVYASWDGSQVQLKLNDHRSQPLIFMDGEIIQNLLDFHNGKIDEANQLED